MDFMLNVVVLERKEEFEASQHASWDPNISLYSNLSQKKRDIKKPAHIRSLTIYRAQIQAKGRLTTP